MRVVFVCGSMYSWGGIQTWLARMAPRLRAEGHEVALLTRPRGEPGDVTSAVVDQLSCNATIHFANRDWFKAPRRVRPPLEDVDVVFACNLESLLRAALVQQHLAPESRLVAGVFAPHEYCWKVPRHRRRWSQHLAERLVRQLPIENLMFCTDAMARQMGDCLARDLSQAKVLPIPIDTERFRPPTTRRIDPHKIVSVARLTPYYTHHRHMIRVIQALRSEGYGFSYHAYGDGPMRAALESEVRLLGVDDAVFFHGAVPYEDFADSVADAFAYIGLGTALIEAAACGVPALVGIDSHPDPLTYGFIQDTVGNDVGGYVPGHPTYLIAERLRWLAHRTDEEYGAVAQASSGRAQEFSMARLFLRFVQFLQAVEEFSFRISSTDRAVGQLDWLLEAVLLNIGVPDHMSRRHIRPAPIEAGEAGSSRSPDP